MNPSMLGMNRTLGKRELVSMPTNRKDEIGALRQMLNSSIAQAAADSQFRTMHLAHAAEAQVKIWKLEGATTEKMIAELQSLFMIALPE